MTGVPCSDWKWSSRRDGSNLDLSRTGGAGPDTTLGSGRGKSVEAFLKKAFCVSSATGLCCGPLWRFAALSVAESLDLFEQELTGLDVLE